MVDDFRVVDASARVRPPRQPRQPNPLIAALLAGETVEVPIREGEAMVDAQRRIQSGAWAKCHRCGYRVHSRQSSPASIVLWAEPIEAEA